MNKIMNKQISPAQLWIGNHTLLETETICFLQKIFCKKNGCHICEICKKINNRQYYGAIWLNTEKYYMLENLKIIFDTIAFQLNNYEKLFFIIQKADFLTESCSNKLLKSVEEPPEGYHFIFLSECASKILPTIRSRCTTKYFNSLTQTATESKLLALFKSQNPSPSIFLKLLEEEKSNEQVILEIINKLLEHWVQKSKNAIQNNKYHDYEKTQYIVSQIQSLLSRTPIPSSGKIFLRNVFLQLNYN